MLLLCFYYHRGHKVTTECTEKFTTECTELPRSSQRSLPRRAQSYHRGHKAVYHRVYRVIIEGHEGCHKGHRVVSGYKGFYYFCLRGFVPFMFLCSHFVASAGCSLFSLCAFFVFWLLCGPICSMWFSLWIFSMCFLLFLRAVTPECPKQPVCPL